ncbi:MAG: Outer membrane protein, OmpA/MotB family protein [Parcubacteria group bacterium GW2011_GWC2_39_14]|nr:MAG: Outer membrane protein, OmpA/MotB family protein [Parcubacteria group bacterium GW2011_GWC2_39_14]KKR55028.1 MAG: Outer membrane protein, OmpA/MotB family protein [Parcubacteria group bacterium GW2011_GWA2_40_23]
MKESTLTASEARLNKMAAMKAEGIRKKAEGAKSAETPQDSETARLLAEKQEAEQTVLRANEALAEDEAVLSQAQELMSDISKLDSETQAELTAEHKAITASVETKKTELIAAQTRLEQALKNLEEANQEQTPEVLSEAATETSTTEVETPEAEGQEPQIDLIAVNDKIQETITGLKAKIDGGELTPTDLANKLETDFKVDPAAVEAYSKMMEEIATLVTDFRRTDEEKADEEAGTKRFNESRQKIVEAHSEAILKEIGKHSEEMAANQILRGKWDSFSSNLMGETAEQAQASKALAEKYAPSGFKIVENEGQEKEVTTRVKAENRIERVIVLSPGLKTIQDMESMLGTMIPRKAKKAEPAQ